MKKRLGVGSVTIDKKDNKGTHIIRDRETLRRVISPIFCGPLTTKHFFYLRFKKVFEILEDTPLTTDQRNLLIWVCGARSSYVRALHTRSQTDRSLDVVDSQHIGEKKPELIGHENNITGAGRAPHIPTTISKKVTAFSNTETTISPGRR